jgi:hypothetical protein
VVRIATGVGEGNSSETAPLAKKKVRPNVATAEILEA